jgi:hypothetical protein
VAAASSASGRAGARGMHTRQMSTAARGRAALSGGGAAGAAASGVWGRRLANVRCVVPTRLISGNGILKYYWS